MSKLTAKDFKDLTVSAYAEKLTKVEDLEFLSELEKLEIADKDRVGVKDAINQKQGELYDQQKAANIEAEIAKTEKKDDLVENDSDGKELVTDSGLTVEDVQEKEKEVPAPPIGDGIAQGTPGEDYPDGPKGISETPGDAGKEYKGEEEVLQKEDEEQDPYEDLETEKKEEESTEQKAKKLRLRLDKILQYSEGHFRIDEDVNDKIFKAKAWLGLLLSFEGSRKNPYKVGRIKTAREIPATAEKHEGTEFLLARRNFGNKDVLEAIQDLRKDLEEVADEVSLFHFDKRKSQICADQAWININEAKFELGKQLSTLRIK